MHNDLSNNSYIKHISTTISSFNKKISICCINNKTSYCNAESIFIKISLYKYYSLSITLSKNLQKDLSCYWKNIYVIYRTRLGNVR